MPDAMPPGSRLLRRGYRLLHAHGPRDGAHAWTPERLRRRLTEGDYEGLELFVRSGFKLADLAFLAGLDDLRILAVETKVTDDRAAFALGGLHELALNTGCKRPVPECELGRLRRLAIPEREGLEARKWPNLDELLLGRWRSGDLRFLAGAALLGFVELQGTGQSFVLDGIETCARLESLITTDASVGDLAPLRGLTHLRELRLVSRSSPHGVLDLRDLRSPVLAKVWLGGAGELLNIASVADLPALEELRVIDTPLTSDDHRFLESIAHRVRVSIVQGSRSRVLAGSAP